MLAFVMIIFKVVMRKKENCVEHIKEISKGGDIMFYFTNYAELFKPEEILDYLRKSQSDDPLLTVEEVLQRHETILDEWDMKHLGALVPEENRFREVVSGEKISERPEFKKVLRLIESPKYKAVKVVEPQRLTRGDLEDIGRLLKILKHTNTYVITADRMSERLYDLRNEDDWNALEAELKRGNDYLKYTKRILNRGRLISVSQGNYIASKPPYGYDRTWVQDGKRKCPTLTENKEEADVVRMIFDMYVNKNMGVHNICYKLDSLHIKPPRGKFWSPESMRDMIENVHYIGKVRWNWRKTMTIVEEGEILETRPRMKIGEFLVYEGKHEGIISEELFNAAQEKKSKNHRTRGDKKLRNPLAGIVYCQCGRSMTMRTYNDKNGNMRAETRLLCNNQARCNTSSCTFDEMTERVCDILEQCIADFEIRLKNDEGDSIKLHANLIKSLEKRLKELQEKELAQWEQQSHPDPAQRMPAEIFKQLNERLLKEKDEVQQALCKARESMPEPINYQEKLKRFKDALEALKDPDVDVVTKNALLKACIERIVYSRERSERLKNPAKRKRVDGKMVTPNALPTGGNWTRPPIKLDVKLKV